jgi:histidinol dehydrogenase
MATNPMEKSMVAVEILSRLSSERLKEILTRSMASFEERQEEVRVILSRLREDPEKELIREYGSLKPAFKLSDLEVGEEELDEAKNKMKPDFEEAIKKAIQNIKAFHLSQLGRPIELTELSPGLLAGRLIRPLERVGVYIPGGRAAYPSSALMNIVPARAAGVETVIACTPPGSDFKARPEILMAVAMAGADRIFKLGGAWAVGAMAYGLGDLPKVDKIVGPGSSWVTAAKLAVYGECDIDLPAGPSEGFIIADEKADPKVLVWDFLAQLEHDPEASAVLATNSRPIAEAVAKGVEEILPGMERFRIVEKSLANAAIIVAESLDECFELSNLYAPEHLELYIEDALSYLGKVRNAGSVFLGSHAPIAAGDYATGTNHVLPTGGAARVFSGLSTDSFLKKITFQRLSREALEEISPAVICLARAEGLPAHAQTLSVRLAKAKPDGN